MAVQRGAEALVSGLESRVSPSAEALDTFAAAMQALRSYASACGSASAAECGALLAPFQRHSLAHALSVLVVCVLCVPVQSFIHTISGSGFGITIFLPVLVCSSILWCRRSLQAGLQRVLRVVVCLAYVIQHSSITKVDMTPRLPFACSGLQGMAARLQRVVLAAGDAAAGGSGGAAGAAVPAAGTRELYDDDLDAGGPAAGAALCALQCPTPSAMSEQYYAMLTNTWHAATRHFYHDQ